MKSSTKFLTTLILLFFLFVISAFIAYKTGTKNKKSVKVTGGETSSETKRDPQQTSELQYRNPQNFEIDVPEGWYLTDHKQFLTSYEARGNYQPSSPFTKCDFAFYEPTNVGYDEDLSKIIPITIIKTSNPKISKMQLISLYEVEGQNSFIFYLIEDNKHEPVTLSCYYLGHEAEIEKILSTFKFLDENSEGKFCGGIAGIICPQGYKCILDGSYPDAGGKCVKN